MLRNVLGVVKSFRSKTEGFSFAITRTVCNICIQIVEDMETVELTAELVNREERSITRLTRIMEYVNAGYMNRITLKELSALESLNMCYLFHFIKDNLGMSFQQYLNKVRIKNAEHMIAGTDKSNLDICIACGFSDYRYLRKAFVAEYGCTPAQYKKNSGSGEAQSLREWMEGYPNGVVSSTRFRKEPLDFLRPEHRKNERRPEAKTACSRYFHGSHSFSWPYAKLRRAICWSVAQHYWTGRTAMLLRPGGLYPP